MEAVLSGSVAMPRTGSKKANRVGQQAVLPTAKEQPGKEQLAKRSGR
jgi:hypothetical protein